ncbi:hypothetical protein [Proteus phage vB_PmiP_RS10pmA]|nr:hypothetical protein [Proteus phage vB_PmiP_RS10pmA]QHJ72804.1 NinX [Proteus phage 2207-N35]QHJ72897.1 NinX [Proteus phage 2207-N35]
MTEFEINKKVAQKLGLEFKCCKSLDYITVVGTPFDPCNNAEQAWEIMLTCDISITKYDDDFIALTSLSSRYSHFDTELLCCDNNIKVNKKPFVAAMLLFLEV